MFFDLLSISIVISWWPQAPMFRLLTKWNSLTEIHGEYHICRGVWGVRGWSNAALVYHLDNPEEFVKGRVFFNSTFSCFRRHIFPRSKVAKDRICRNPWDKVLFFLRRSSVNFCWPQTKRLYTKEAVVLFGIFFLSQVFHVIITRVGKGDRFRVWFEIPRDDYRAVRIDSKDMQ